MRQKPRQEGPNVSLVDPNDSSRSAEFDNKFKVPIFIDVDHHKVHEGNSFSFDHTENSNGFSICFKTPAGLKLCHMIISWSSESQAEVQFWEGREWDASSGSLITIYNRDRNSSNTSIALEDQSTGSFIPNSSFILSPNNIGAGGNDAGIEIHHWESWSDKKVTNLSRGITEWILKTDETYVVTYVSNDGIKQCHLDLNWYEHTDE